MKISVTGRVSIEADGRILGEQSFPGRQGRLVFAYLVAAEGRPVPRDELADVLWGDARPATWDKALSVLVSKLRALLEECGIDGQVALTSAFGCYQLVVPAGVWLDVTAARDAADAADAALAAGDVAGARDAAAEAVALARRGFLPGEDGEWIGEKRRELNELLVRALECLSDASLAAGDLRGAVRSAEGLTALEPYREGGYRRLMRTHAAAGDSAEALRVYERCRRLLADELGAYPSPETQTIYRELLTAPTPVVRRAPEEAPPLAVRQAHERTSSGGARLSARRVGFLVLGFATALLVAAVVALLLGRGSGGPELRAAAPNSIAVVDPGSGRLVADVPVGAGPTSLAIGDGAIWVANSADQSVERIARDTRSVRQTVRVGESPSAIAFGLGAAWVANGLVGEVSRIDAATNEVVQTVKVGNSPSAIAFGARAVWVANADDGTVSKIDPASGQVVATIAVDVAARGIAIAGGALWVSDPPGNAVVRVDLRTLDVTNRVSVGNAPTAVTSGLGDVWVTNNLDGTVTRIDAERAIVVDTVPVGTAPNGIAVVRNGVWVTDEAAGTLVRVDPRSGSVTRRSLGGRPRGLVFADGALWVAVQAGDAAHRGGTLRVLTGEGVEVPDPSRSYNDLAWTLLILTHDGLVAFKRVGGVEGTAVVPNLATALPVPTGRGRTYTFQLRRGVRFSSGRVVKPSDIRFTMERIFRVSSPGRGFYTGIVGGPACVRRPARCDLSRGVVPDDVAQTVTFRLTEPDPEFLYKLALPLAFVVPRGTPLSGAQPVPGTGPYRVERYERKRLIRFVRNRHFAPWASAAQPQGSADAIDVRRRSSAAARTAAVRVGTADVSDLPNERLDEARTRYPAQVRITTRAATMYVQPNTTRPPFGSVDARKALAQAIDRAQLVERAGGSDVVEATCRIFPPNSPGYRPYCPRTSTPRADMAGRGVAGARELVARSGTRGMRVDVISVNRDALFTATAAVVTDALRHLGYRVSLRTYPDFAPYFDAYFSGAASVEVAFSVWFQDYPAPSNFIRGVFACGPYFCDRPTERSVRRILRVQARDPRAAVERWERLERDLLDRAIVIPLVNPKEVVFLSKRVGNYQRHPVFGPLIGQLWVR